MSIYKKKITAIATVTVFSLILCCSLFAFPKDAFADTYTSSGIEYTYTPGSGTAEVSGFTGTPVDVSILGSFADGGNTYTVTSIGATAFYNCTSLESISIPNSVTSIGATAFRDCTSLTGITIPDSIASIGSDAFYGCSSITSITIPGSVTSIGQGAFAYCSSLSNIIIPDSITSIGEATFYECTGLSNIIIPDSITSIGEVAFYGCTSLKAAFILGSPSISSNSFLNSAPGGLINKPSELSAYKFYTEATHSNEWDFTTDTRTNGDPTTLLFGVGAGSGSNGNGSSVNKISEVWIRNVEMTCYQVWINHDNNFEFVFWWEYANNNWVQIYDMAGILVFEIGMEHGDARFEAPLPDGMYTVKTFHEAGNILQEFVIGKP